MKIDFEYYELMTIKDAIEQHRTNTWNNKIAPRIKKGTPRELIKEVYDEFSAQRNKFTEEGKCNTILEKIQRLQDKLKKVMEE